MHHRSTANAGGCEVRSTVISGGGKITPVIVPANDIVVPEKDKMPPQLKKDPQVGGRGGGDDEEEEEERRCDRNKLNLKEVEAAALEGTAHHVSAPPLRRTMSMIEMKELADIRDFDGHMQAMSAAEYGDDAVAVATTAFPFAGGVEEKPKQDGGFFFFDDDDDCADNAAQTTNFVSGLDDSPPSLATMRKSRSFAALSSNNEAPSGTEEEEERLEDEEQIDNYTHEAEEYFEPVRFEPVEPVDEKDEKIGDTTSQSNEFYEAVRFEPVKPVKKKSLMKKSLSMSRLIPDVSTQSSRSASFGGFDPTARPKRSSLKKSVSSGALGQDDQARADDSPGMKRNVSFHKLEMREYELTLGDNAACSRGPPVQLGWTYNEANVVTIDDYEANRGDRRSRRQMILSHNDRWWRLMRESGCTVQDLKRAMNEVEKTKKGRKNSIKQMKRKEKIDRTVGSVGRKMRSLLK